MQRRDFFYAAAGLPLLAGAARAGQAGPPAPLGSGKKIRLAVLGGGFATHFYWHEHPHCEVVAATDLRADRRKKLRDTFRTGNIYHSYEELLRKEKNLDAVAVFSGAPDHYKHTEMAMRRGFHVVAAVPAVFSLEEAEKLKQLKEKTGLRYMLNETSYYRQGCIYARNAYQRGDFGELFYSELEYYHDRGDLKELAENKQSRFFEPGGKPSWRWGMPPLHYPTHSLGYLVGVTGERITSVSALGWGSQHPATESNRYNNPFWNEASLMETAQGHMTRCNVFWLLAGHGERAQWFGDRASFYMAKGGIHGDTWRDRLDAGGSAGQAREIEMPTYLDDPMLPPPMRHASGHGGSHVFLSAEFINSLVEDREPAIGVYDALAMTVPGIVGHQSALKNGERMPVPRFDPA